MDSYSTDPLFTNYSSTISWPVVLLIVGGSLHLCLLFLPEDKGVGYNGGKHGAGFVGSDALS